MKINIQTQAGALKKKEFWQIWSAPLILIALIFLTPLFFLSNSFLFDYSKIIILIIAVIPTLILWLVARLRENTVTVSVGCITGSLIFLALSYIVSALVSSHRLLALIGNGFETGTASTLALLVLLAIMTSVYFKDKNRIIYLYGVLMLSAGILALYHILRFPFLFGSSFLSFGILTNATSNTIGSWTDFGIFYGAIALISFISLETLSFGKIFRGILIYTLIASLLFLVLVNFPLIWYVLGATALTFFILSVIASQSQKKVETRSTISLVSLGVLIIAFVCIIANGPLKNITSPLFNISFLEARPSWQTTLEIGKKVFQTQPVFGVSPNQFGPLWLREKTNQINQTIFWNLDFTNAVGFVPTSIISTGALGALAWLLFFFWFLYVGFRSLVRGSSTLITRYTHQTSFFVTLYLWVFSVVYVPSPAIMILTFVFTGLFIATHGDGLTFRKTISFIESPRKVGLFILCVTIILMATAGWTYIFARNLVAETFFAKGATLFSRGQNLEQAEQYTANALTINPTESSYRLMSSIELARLQTVVAQKNISPDVLRAQFQSLLTNAIISAQNAISYNTSNYNNYVNLGQVYETVVPYKAVASAYESALKSYQSAVALNPASPTILLYMARLEATAGNFTKAKDDIRLAIAQKPDYIDAIFLLSQVQVSEGDSASAIQSVQAAVSVSPNNPLLYFQLGLLRYNTKDYSGAASALGQAIALAPDYANAKYFLGLSLDKLGKTDQAIALFEDLARTNSTNQEISLILKNLKEGRSAFADSKPPIDDKPEKRKELPVKEKSTSKSVAPESKGDSTNP